MGHRDDGHEGAASRPEPAGSTPQSVETVNADVLAAAFDKSRRHDGRRKLARRALLATAGLGLCAGAVELTPLALQKAGQFTEKELQDAFGAGVDAGRQALLNELAQLEGVTLDGAITIAELTRLAVKYIVVPLANLTSTIEGDGLQILINAVSTARSNLARFNIRVDWLDNLQRLLSTWHDSVTRLPKQLNDYATADINGTEAYLKALKSKIAAEQAGKSTPSA